MLILKIFIKKIKIGKILKIVCEYYFWDDIMCGVGSCRECDGLFILEVVFISFSEMC